MRDGHDYPAGTPEGNPAEAASRRLFVLVLALLPSLACVATAQEKRPQPAAGREWARPGELRSKKLIDAGIHTLDSKLNSRWLAEHPEFTTTHPFDGMAVRISLDEQWRKKAGLAEGAYFDDLAWSTQPVPHEAVKAAIDDLLRAKWGQLTDNFLWWNLRGGIKVQGGRPEGSLVRHRAIRIVRGNEIPLPVRQGKTGHVDGPRTGVDPGGSAGVPGRQDYVYVRVGP